MFTYIVMGVPFIAFVLLLDTVFLKTWVIKTKNCWIVMGILMLSTLIFDQLLTGLPIVFYDETKMLGLKLWYAPIEDFTYTFAVVIGLGSLLTYLTKREKAEPKD